MAAPAVPGSLPLKLRSLDDLGLVLKSELTQWQKMEVLLGWLAKERKHPSLPTGGLGGYPINSDWLQRNIGAALMQVSDPLALRWLTSSGKVSDRAIRDSLHLVLAGMGDTTQIPALIRILRSSPVGWQRGQAAGMLGSFGASEAVPTLRRALTDDYYLVSEGGLHSAKGDRNYPVREAAEVALRVIRLRPTQPELRRYGHERDQRFAKRLAEARARAEQTKRQYANLLQILESNP